MPHPGALIPAGTCNDSLPQHAEIQPACELGVVLPAPYEGLPCSCVPQLDCHVVAARGQEVLRMRGEEDTADGIPAAGTICCMAPAHIKMMSSRFSPVPRQRQHLPLWHPDIPDLDGLVLQGFKGFCFRF